jgi:hypothetical protein
MASGPQRPVRGDEIVERHELVAQAAELVVHVAGANGRPATLSAVTHHGEHLGGDLRDLHRSTGRDQRNRKRTRR